MTVHISQLFDPEMLEEYVRQGWISKDVHPNLDLCMYNYTPKTTYANKWDDLTEQSRGLILNSQGHVVVRPLPKIHAINEYDDATRKSFDSLYIKAVQEKIDGSIVHLVKYNDHVFMTTRGKFLSPQGVEATKILHNKYKRFVDMVSASEGTFNYESNFPLSFCFELVSNNNKIVIDYGDTRDIILLGAISINSGAGWRPENLGEWQGPIAKTVALGEGYNTKIKDVQDAVAKDTPNTEGYIVVFSPKDYKDPREFRLKFKTPTYLRMAKILTYMDKRAVWESLADGVSLIEKFPLLEGDVFEWIIQVEKELKEAFYNLDAQIYQEFCDVRGRLGAYDPSNRKEWAQEFKKYKYYHVMFKMLDEENYSKYIWEALRPVGNKNTMYGDSSELLEKV